MLLRDLKFHNIIGFTLMFKYYLILYYIIIKYYLYILYNIFSFAVTIIIYYSPYKNVYNDKINYCYF